FIVSREGIVIFYNDEASVMFGYNRDELTGQPVEKHVPEISQLLHSKDIGNYFEDPDSRSSGAGLDIYALRKDGTKFPVDITLGPMQDRGETRVLAVIRDISRFQQAQDKLEREKRF